MGLKSFFFLTKRNPINRTGSSRIDGYQTGGEREGLELWPKRVCDARCRKMVGMMGECRPECGNLCLCRDAMMITPGVAVRNVDVGVGRGDDVDK